MDSVNCGNDKKIKVFMISDHSLATSGVALQSRFVAEALIKTGRYTVFQFGGAISHSNHDPIQVSPYGDDFRIVPVNGFGDKMQIRTAIAVEKPDIMFLFTDPRFFIHIFEMEDEIHDCLPIIYWNIWDNYPVPTFNHVLYDSCDTLNCINKVAFNSINEMGLGHKCNYIPHTLPPGMFKRLERKDIKAYRANIFGKERVDHFIVSWVNRNARRKQPGDLLMGWKQFIEKLEAEEGHKKATLVMHTNPLDQEGPNLFKMIEMLGVQDTVFLSNSKLDQAQMNVLYNCIDWNCTISSAEGFGLSILEAKHVGVPSITQKTGGLKDQLINDETGEYFGICKDPDCITLVGSQAVPHIHDNYLTWETISGAIYEAYKMPKDEYDKLSRRCMEDIEERFKYEDMVQKWDESIIDTVEKYKANKNKPRYTLQTL